MNTEPQWWLDRIPQTVSRAFAALQDEPTHQHAVSPRVVPHVAAGGDGGEAETQAPVMLSAERAARAIQRMIGERKSG